MSPDLVAAAGCVAEKRRPSALEVSVGLREDKVPSLDHLTNIALMTSTMIELFREKGRLWFPTPLANGTLIWFNDIEERVATDRLCISSSPTQVEVLLPAGVVVVAEQTASLKSMIVGEWVCRSLASYIALDRLIEDGGGLTPNPHE